MVENKIKEAEYFLQLLKEKKSSYQEFSFILSAFASAARSITFSLQASMSHYPNFKEWYEPRQKQLKENSLAKYFVDLRNYMQKVGGAPVAHAGTLKDGVKNYHTLFFPINDLKDTPSGDVVELAQELFKNILIIIKQCYKDYAVYVDPRIIFTIEGLAQLGWSIEDLEESFSLPRGWTDLGNGKDNSKKRLAVLKKEFQKNEEMEFYFKKYNIK